MHLSILFIAFTNIVIFKMYQFTKSVQILFTTISGALSEILSMNVWLFLYRLDELGRKYVHHDQRSAARRKPAKCKTA